MSNINFENDKFIPTPLPEICASRRGVLDIYYRAAQKRLIVVCAPAGYGKTVSTLLWVKDSGCRSVWIGLDEYDNAPFVFYKLFCTGILSVQPNNVKMQEILSNKNFYSSPVEHTINLLMEFAQDGQSYVLILDDLQTITNKEILKSLPYILKRMPHSFNVLLLSRSNLSEEFHEYIESRNAVVITANELIFSIEEIQKFYGDLGHTITKAQAQAVFDATGGWAISINALSKSEPFDTLQGSGQLLNNYIDRNIWEKWDRTLRSFMLMTSVADEMDSELCRILTGETNTEKILNTLVAQNLFVVRTSQSTYRYHHLFLEFLRDKLKRNPDVDVQELRLKVADFYFERQDYFKALTYYVRAENDKGINMCYFQLNSSFLNISVEEWLNYFKVFVLDKLPEKFVKNNISLVYESAWSNYMNGNAQSTLEFIDIANNYIAHEQNFTMMKENNFLGFFCTMWFIDFRKGICEYTENLSSWIKTLPGQNYDLINIYTPTITLNFPFMHRSFRDFLEIVVDMDNRLQAIKEVFDTFFHDEVDILCHCVKAGLYYEQNMLEKAHEVILLAQSELKNDLRFEIEFCFYILLSEILNAMEKFTESKNARMYFLGRIKEENASYLNPNFLAIDTKHRLWDADREAAKIWLEQLFVTDDGQLRFYKLYQYFTTARAYIVLSDPDKAMEYLYKLKKLSADYHRPLDFAEAGVLQAALKWATGSEKEAVQMLEEILLMMQQFCAVRIIADEGAAVLPILKKITVKIDRADYHGQLDRHYLRQVSLCAYQVSKRHKGITAHFIEKPVKLSKQQKYILTMLAQGYKSVEITNITGLTINTIKTHTKIIYSKLNVNNAADAVLEAKRLGIIES